MRRDDAAQETHDHLQQVRAKRAQATGCGPAFQARGIILLPWLQAARERMVGLWGREIDKRKIA